MPWIILGHPGRREFSVTPAAASFGRRDPRGRGSVPATGKDEAPAHAQALPRCTPFRSGLAAAARSRQGRAGPVPRPCWRRRRCGAQPCPLARRPDVGVAAFCRGWRRLGRPPHGHAAARAVAVGGLWSALADGWRRLRLRRVRCHFTQPLRHGRYGAQIFVRVARVSPPRPLHATAALSSGWRCAHARCACRAEKYALPWGTAGQPVDQPIRQALDVVSQASETPCRTRLRVVRPMRCDCSPRVERVIKLTTCVTLRCAARATRRLFRDQDRQRRRASPPGSLPPKCFDVAGDLPAACGRRAGGGWDQRAALTNTSVRPAPCG